MVLWCRPDDAQRTPEFGTYLPMTVTDERERLLRMLAAATFIIFFQAYMVAPIIPALSNAFGTSVQTVGLIVPAYLIPYGIATLVYGLLADRLGIHRLMFLSLAAFSVLTTVTATASSIEQIAVWRVLTGLGASGVVPLALVHEDASVAPWQAAPIRHASMTSRSGCRVRDLTAVEAERPGAVVRTRSLSGMVATCREGSSPFRRAGSRPRRPSLRPPRTSSPAR